MGVEEDRALLDSVLKLNDTAGSLAALVKVVGNTQKLLVANQGAATENAEAISLRSTKQELLDEVKRLAAERKKDRLKTKLTVGGSFFVSILLIFAIALTVTEYKSARNDANVAYSQAAMNVCLQRSSAWEAMQAWINTQRLLEADNPYIDEAFRAKRIAALDELLKRFPDVDCSIGSALTTLVPPVSGGYQDDSLLAILKPVPQTQVGTRSNQTIWSKDGD